MNTVHKMNKIQQLLLFLPLLTVTVTEAQNFTELIEHCWDSNKQLKAREFQLSQAEAFLAEAKAMYRPTISAGTQYTLASGGRTIDFPVGDLLNPVHTELNELTGSGKFPTLQNQTILFLPNNFYDARVRIQQPIFYPELAVNRSLKSKQFDLQALEIKAFKRLLVREFMDAYFNWKQAVQALLIYQQADTLLREASRTTQSLILNGVALPSSLSRIESELATVHAQHIEALAGEENAWNYLLFLLGSDQFSREELHVDIPELPNVASVNSGYREELMQLDVAIEMQDLAIDMENIFHKPRIGAQLDLGSQDFNFGLEPYALFGINLEWNLFDGKRHQFRKEQAKAGLQSQQEQKNYVSEQLTLQVAVAQRNLQAGIDQAETFKPRILATNKTYREILKKYQAGSANYLELLDARTQVTQSEIAFLISRYQAWNRWAEYIYSSASYPIT